MRKGLTTIVRKIKNKLIDDNCFTLEHNFKSKFERCLLTVLVRNSVNTY